MVFQYEVMSLGENQTEFVSQTLWFGADSVMSYFPVLWFLFFLAAAIMYTFLVSFLKHYGRCG